MRTCVTGGAGFIGSNLVDRLVEAGHEVVVFDDLSTGSRANVAAVADRIEFVVGDVRDPAAVARAVRGAAVVFHQAALASVVKSVEDPVVTNEVNVVGTLHVLQAARAAGARRVVFASSSSVYGDTTDLPIEESRPIAPLSPYAASKAAAEAYLRAFQDTYGLETVALRYFNVYGPRQAPDSEYAAVVPRFVDAMLGGRPPTIFGDGGQTRDFTYVGDVVDALVRAAEAPGPFRAPINVGCGARLSVLDLAQAVAEATGFEGAPVHEDVRVGDVRDSMASIERAAADLGWRPATPLAEGIRLTVGAMRSHLLGLPGVAAKPGGDDQPADARG